MPILVPMFNFYKVGLKGFYVFEISRYSAAKGEKPAPLCLSAIFGKIDQKYRNHVQAFQSNAVHVLVLPKCTTYYRNVDVQKSWMCNKSMKKCHVHIRQAIEFHFPYWLLHISALLPIAIPESWQYERNSSRRNCGSVRGARLVMDYRMLTLNLKLHFTA